MVLAEVAVQYVEMSTFVTVIIAVITLILIIASIVSSRVSGLSERLSKTEEKNLNDEKTLNVVFEKINHLDKQRVTDVIQFNETLGKINVTLGKLETQLENSNEVMQEVKNALHDQNREINKLKQGG